eukprot:CAMPEP_0184398098 /NCGR_PEP_ID=MMETSP0007-20130409/64022_1 /TAXON_ID=97485 /ORGANISM="Prymnesium parvum, Strain Texoma1" /LENGTH=41 /DNA_ID= /DNA_START= /DNA_END= /DNA_ORIENTATION=
MTTSACLHAPLRGIRFTSNAPSATSTKQSLSSNVAPIVPER